MKAFDELLLELNKRIYGEKTVDHIKSLEAKIHELDALNTDLTDLYNKHMKSWVEREKKLERRIAVLQRIVKKGIENW